MFRRALTAAVLTCGVVVSAVAQQSRLVFDARTLPVPAELPSMGANRSPDGHSIGVTTQFLTMDGRPWLPVMGEFHFSRYPAAYWAEELAKMKAAGVDVVATYVFWNHHEELEGQFDWSGQRNLRQFLQLCHQQGLYAVVRIGPWAHGEARYGGLPDWVVARGHLRTADPVFMNEVAPYMRQVGAQLQGQLWKDGGPVIGIQIENEYSNRSADGGATYLLALKRMARDAGMDVPLYTETGWDNAVVPQGELLPVFGGYADAPWDGASTQLPPSEVYLFRTGSRASGDMGAQGARAPQAATNDNATPFLTAEIGGGVQDTYHRRPVITADDTTAMANVMLGSGVNLLGYYMFHGGENPEGKRSTLQESQRTGYPTDVPVESYDFQAPLGEFGFSRASLGKLRMLHSFVHDFGTKLAAMPAVAAEPQPSGPADTGTLRASVRTDGDSAFIFFNNYVRHVAMPRRPAVQFVLQTTHGTVQVPEQPVAIPSESYGVWPLHMRLEGTSSVLEYATAQPLCVIHGVHRVRYFFTPTDGVPAEFAFAAGTAVTAQKATRRQTQDRVVFTSITPGYDVALRIGEAEIVLLPRAEAEHATKLTLAGQEQLLLTTAQLFAMGRELQLRQPGERRFVVRMSPGLPVPAGDGWQAGWATGVFTSYSATMAPAVWTMHWRTVQGPSSRAAATLGPKQSWRKEQIEMAPDDADFRAASRTQIAIAGGFAPAVSDLLLEVRYSGDVARLKSGDRLLTDDFFNGEPWVIGLKRFAAQLKGGLELDVLPWPPHSHTYLERDVPERTAAAGGSVQSIRLTPEYEARFAF
ncbi:MAG: beta-galactosidase [Acidobacteriota bacterium]|nr:beta-galactosidase [Acidobacteriota bacterium]